MPLRHQPLEFRHRGQASARKVHAGTNVVARYIV
jgi:hypothetical protein